MKGKHRNCDILLHVCCAPCACASTERLLEEGYHPLLLFANSNIYPFEEFEKRRSYVEQLAQSYELPLEIIPWDHNDWLDHTVQWKHEPEGGRRCAECFRYNLGKSAELSEKLLISQFTTTLSISPHKSSSMIFEAGREFSGFLEIDFKKNGGFSRSIELSKSYGLYRQSFCGCEFSR